MKIVTCILVIAAALRLGIIGFFGPDFIGSILGSPTITMSVVDKVVCAIVGVAGLYAIYLLIVEQTNKEVI